MAVEGPFLCAHLHAAGVEQADSHFYSAMLASDGCIYYTLCTHRYDKHGTMCRYDPSRNEVSVLWDFGQAFGETDTRTVSQGKSHAPYYELDGRLFFSTHVGYFAVTQDNREVPAQSSPEGYAPYPGGHCAYYDLKTGKITDLGIPVKGQGIITFNIDRQRQRLYMITWPNGHFVHYDLRTKRFHDFGPAFLDGEIGRGERYCILCRALAVQPQDGSVYFTHPDGSLHRYSYSRDALEEVGGVSLKRDILGQHDPHQPGSMVYHWREIFWHPEHQVFYGIHPHSGYLFTFDPAAGEIRLMERITARSLRQSGQYEPYRHGYGAVALGRDRQTIYYLTGIPRPGFASPKNGLLRLTTYNLQSGRYDDWGTVRLEDGRYLALTHSIIPHPNGRLYAVPWLVSGAATPDHDPHQVDLVSFDNPVATGRAMARRKA